MAKLVTSPSPSSSENARKLWSTGDFDVLAAQASHPAAAHVVRVASVAPGDRVLDVATGTGAVAMAAAARGADVVGQDLTPSLLDRARQHAEVAGLDIRFDESDAQDLPYDDAAFDVVVSQWGHMFAPDPAATIQEMVRVLRPGGRLVINTWPPEMLTGRLFALAAKYNPPPKGAPSPLMWGEPSVIRQRLEGMEDIAFHRHYITIASPSPQHYRKLFETVFGPTMLLVQALQGDPERLAGWRQEHDAIVAQYHHEGRVRQDYLITRAVKP